MNATIHQSYGKQLWNKLGFKCLKYCKSFANYFLIFLTVSAQQATAAALEDQELQMRNI